MLPKLSAQVANDIHLALSFFFLYTSFNTLSHIQKTLTASTQIENPSYAVDGFVVLGIIYAANVMCTWLAPFIILLFGTKLAMVLGAISFGPFVLTSYFVNDWFIYGTAALAGAGSALIWTGQGQYVILNSEVGNVYGSISCFWLIYKCSFLVGDAIVYFEFNNPSEIIRSETRLRIAIILMLFVVISVIFFSTLKSPLRGINDVAKSCSFKTQMKMGYSIFTLKQFLILGELFSYVGLHISFLSVSAMSLGFSEYLSANSKKYAPLSGVLQGFGEIGGSCWCLYLKSKTHRPGKILFITGCLANFISYVIVYLGLPDDSVYTYTESKPIIPTPIVFLLLSQILIGLGDACFQVELYQWIGTLYPDDGVTAFAILNFFCWICLAAAYFYSSFLGLYTQIWILAFGLILTIIIQSFSRAKNLLSKERDELILYVNRNQNYNTTEVNLEDERSKQR